MTVTTELAPTERAVMFRFTYPETKNAYVIVDAFDKGSYVKVIPKENKIIGYSTKNSGVCRKTSKTTCSSIRQTVHIRFHSFRKQHSSE